MVTQRRNFVARPIFSEAERQAVFNLRYRVYVEERGLAQTHADHELKQLQESLDPMLGTTHFDNGGIIGVFDGEQLVGSLRVNWCTQDIGDYRDYYGLDELQVLPEHNATIITRLCVEQDYRGSYATYLLFLELAQFLLINNSKIVFADCKPTLKPLFERLGWLQFMPNFKHSPELEVHPIYCLCNDLQHFKSVRSPITRYEHLMVKNDLSIRYFSDRVQMLASYQDAS